MASKRQHKKDKKILLYGVGIFLLGFFGLMYYLKEKVAAENGSTLV